MEASIQSRNGLRWKLLLGLTALPIGVLVVVAVVRPAPERVRLLHVGFADHGNRGRSPVFCLTNGGSTPILFGDDAAGTPFRYRVQTDSGWSVTYSNRDGFGMAPRMNVLKPGECVQFEFGRPLSLHGWRIGIAYYPCETGPPLWVTNGPIYRMAGMYPANAIVGSTNFFLVSPGMSSARPNFVRAQTVGDRIANRLPRFTPRAIGRLLRSKNHDLVAWGPVVEW